MSITHLSEVPHPSSNRLSNQHASTACLPTNKQSPQFLPSWLNARSGVDEPRPPLLLASLLTFILSAHVSDVKWVSPGDFRDTSQTVDKVISILCILTIFSLSVIFSSICISPQPNTQLSRRVTCLSLARVHQRRVLPNKNIWFH